MSESAPWRRCSACKKPIALGAKYWVCNVSTCNRKRTGLVFCTLDCWEVHLPTAKHRKSWALERVAPTRPESPAATPASATAGGDGGTRRLVRPQPAPAPRSRAPEEVLVVASRLKAYVRAKSGYNTSDGVLEPLSDIVRRVCDEAIENARREGRMTVLDRDVPDA